MDEVNTHSETPPHIQIVGAETSRATYSPSSSDGSSNSEPPAMPAIPAPLGLKTADRFFAHSTVPSRRGSPEALQQAGELTYVRATCHCRRSTMRVAFHTNTLPIPAYFCNCSSCRHNGGQMAFHSVRILGKPRLPSGSTAAVPVEKILKAYSPPDRPGITRYFCPVCSAIMLVHVLVGPNMEVEDEKHAHVDPPQPWESGPHAIDYLPTAEGYWRVAGGALQQAEGIIQPVCHTNVASTLDGGFADQLRTVSGIHMARYSEGYGSPEVPLPWRSSALSKDQPPAELLAYCDCRSIQIKISRPDGRAETPSAPFPDLIYPASTTRLSKMRNIKDVKWWVRPPLHDGGPGRFLAGHCVCSFCRLTSGYEVQSWGWVVREFITEVGKDEPISFSMPEKRPDGLKQYVPSPGRFYEFCKTCGATAFWWTASRPDVVDVSMGLIDEEQAGARADDWFDWHTERVSFSETSASPQLVSALVEGLRATRI